MDAIECLGRCIGLAKEVGHGASASVVGDHNARLQWLERQMANLILQLQGMMVDLESGLSLSDIGFDGEADFVEMLEEMTITIQNLKGQILTLRQVGR